MKAISVSKAVLSMVVSSACAFMVACGAGSDVPPAPLVKVASTQNPMVAQVTVASECAGTAMVEFGPDTSYGRNTAWYPVSGLYRETPILVAGMKASATYHMRVQIQCAGNSATSADMTFATGPLPSLPFPALTVTRPNPSLSSLENPGIELLVLNPLGGPPSMLAFFTDRDANPIWYYDVGAGSAPIDYKLLPNGHLVIGIATGGTVLAPSTSLIREIDLAGNTIRELDTPTLQRKARNAGYDFVPGFFHHNVLPLANGHLIVLVGTAKSFTDLPGYGNIAVAGDALIDLDENWNPVWAWNSFDYLDVNRHVDGLPDWTHSNNVIYSPDDGNIILSMRNQSWVLKIDYNNGAGTGNVIWKLGYQGNFSLTDAGVPTDDPSLWFANQHFPTILSQSGSQTTLAIWDNGDNRVLNDSGEICIAVGGVPCYSRATIFSLDEGSMVANLQWADPQNLFGIWGGSINQLANGNVEFDLNDPAIPPSSDPNLASQVQEVTQTSTPQVIWQMDVPVATYAYRAYRVPSLYPGVTWQF
jgi:arylsulfate sulfotransferase